MKKIILTILVLAIFMSHSYAIFYGNRSCEAYNSCDTEEINRSGTPGMGILLVQGGGYFLMSHSEMSKFLNKIEMAELQGTDYIELKTILDSAIENMENASGIYKSIIYIAKVTPYNQDVLTRLKLFAYNEYREKNSLNGEIFDEVKKYLAEGDVTGAYTQMKAEMDGILTELYALKSDIDEGVIPKTPMLWRVIQKYNCSFLFGMYIAQVFMNL